MEIYNIKRETTSETIGITEKDKSIAKSHRLYVEIMTFIMDRLDGEKATEAEVIMILVGILSSTLGAFDTKLDALMALEVINRRTPGMIIRKFDERAQQPEEGKEEQP